MVLTGVQIAPEGQLAGGAAETVVPAGNTELLTNWRILRGRRGPMGPGPGSALLMRSARWRWMPRAPRYPISRVVSRPRLFSTEVLHCWTCCAGACGSKVVKLTVVVPRTAGLKLSEVCAMAALSREAGGLKLSNCCVSGKTYGTLWRWLHQVFKSTGVKKIP